MSGVVLEVPRAGALASVDAASGLGGDRSLYPNSVDSQESLASAKPRKYLRPMRKIIALAKLPWMTVCIAPFIFFLARTMRATRASHHNPGNAARANPELANTCSGSCAFRAHWSLLLSPANRRAPLRRKSPLVGQDQAPRRSCICTRGKPPRIPSLRSSADRWARLEDG